MVSEVTFSPPNLGRYSTDSGGKAGGLLAAAQELEGTFVYEMLKAAGIGKPRDGFGGGAGEDHFSHFLLEQHATEISKAGGIGLAAAIFENLLEKAEV